MGKIVKYCSSCDESFAEKFGFCPTCGAALEAFEMNPLGARVEPETVDAALPVEAERVEATVPMFAAPVPLVTEIVPEPVVAAPAPEPEIVIPTPEPVITAPVAETVVETKPEPIVKTKPASAKADVWPPKAAKTPVFTSPAKNADARPKSLEDEHNRYVRDGGFYVTVIEEKNVKTRNGLLLGTFMLLLCTLMGGMVYNIFSKDLNIGAINDEIFMAVLADIDPMKIEEVKEQKKKDDEDGGGGGGGKNEKDPASQGDLTDQSKNPARPPDVNTTRSDTPMLPPPSSEGVLKFPKIFDKWGNPNGVPGLSNGNGTGGGIGSGRGTGQGNGNGTGAGNGDGSGFGNGSGNGNGNGAGDGDGVPPKLPPVGPSSPFRITSKQKPAYTDAARQNQVTGSVLLKVTFLASGAIGSISTVKGLPYGLTENAIAAARNMKFEPLKINGVPQNVTKTVDFSFTIY